MIRDLQVYSLCSSLSSEKSYCAHHLILFARNTINELLTVWIIGKSIVANEIHISVLSDFHQNSSLSFGTNIMKYLVVMHMPNRISRAENLNVSYGTNSLDFESRGMSALNLQFLAHLALEHLRRP